MKFFVFLLMLYTSLHASNSALLIVKDADVSVKINGDKKNLQKDTQLNLTGGDSVCFLSGDGRVIINDYKQLSKNNKTCFIVPISKNTDIKELINSMKDKVYVAYFDSTESVKHGSSPKGNNDQLSTEIVLNKDQDLLINSDRFGPLPVEILLYDENDVLLDKFSNENESITFLIFPYKSLKSGYKFKVVNGFNQELLKIKMILKY